ncbi:MAG: winged helix DNA-binding protein [Kordiimonadaceae bacterium]|nr:winged helix DNA-binding protein [Kordiimonadaceae bacterium]MBO6567213.1 winged helix DNA-binding protein [Kordiimonadaceae bacterium]MBO6963572.1 winged helix DNA-binding protein [Kordiimonadaceae bacterium]
MGKNMQERVFVARHMRNLSIQLMEAGHHLCQELHPKLQPTWGGLLGHMKGGATLNVTQAAKKLNVSHVHAQKLLKSMQAEGAVHSWPDPKDGRSTIYQLTDFGEQLVPTVEVLGAAIQDVLDDIKNETGHDLTAALQTFVQALNSRDWQTRVREKIDSEKENNDEN